MAVIAETFRRCVRKCRDKGERVAGEVEICWAGMDNPDRFLALHEMVDMDSDFGLQGDLSHLMGCLLGIDRVQGYNPDTALLPEDFAFDDEARLQVAQTQLAERLRHVLFDLHAAQNNGKVHGAGGHEATMKHCLPYAEDGKIRHQKVAPLWLLNGDGTRNEVIDGFSWDGCMFPNSDLTNPQTFNDVLRYMVEMEEAANAAVVAK